MAHVSPAPWTPARPVDVATSAACRASGSVRGYTTIMQRGYTTVRRARACRASGSASISTKRTRSRSVGEPRTCATSCSWLAMARSRLRGGAWNGVCVAWRGPACVSCGVVWHAVAWCCAVWCGAVWCCVAWRGAVPPACRVAWRGVAWRGMVEARGGKAGGREAGATAGVAPEPRLAEPPACAQARARPRGGQAGAAQASGEKGATAVSRDPCGTRERSTKIVRHLGAS